jgi:hypothetical protein
MFTVEDMAGLTNATESRPGPSVVASGTPPVLALTGETGFDTDGVGPDTGVNTTVFEFRVKYSDVEGDSPLNDEVMVWVDLNMNGTDETGEWFVMEEFNVSNTDFVAGKIYTYSTTLSSMGTYNHSFKASDINFNPAVLGPFSGPTMTGMNDPPTLAWTGEVDFETDGLDPETGNSSETVFHYRVSYTDTNDDAPFADHPKVWVDYDKDGVKDVGEWETMLEVDPNDVTYSDGKIYTFDTTFTEGGTYNYSFMALDLNEGVATGLPTADHEGPTVTYVPPVLNPPVLSWLGIGGYTDRGVDPAMGEPGTAFVYKVNYTEVDGELPAAGYPMIWIDLDQNGSYDVGENFTMTEENATDSDVTDGKVYAFTRTLDDIGSAYKYLVEAVDEAGTRAVNMTGTGPVVRANQAPVLEFSTAAGFVTDGVHPDSAVKGTEFTYMVSYRDLDGDAPVNDKVSVLIDKNGDGDRTDPGEEVDMVEVLASDTDFTDGKEYKATHVFQAAGTYTYQFKASDLGGLAAAGPASAVLTGPEVLESPPNLPPELLFAGTTGFMFDGVDPTMDEVGSTFTFKVVYFDPEGDAPKSGFPVLLLDVNGDGSFTGDKDMNLSMTSGGNVTGGTLYSVQVQLEDAGTLGYRFFVVNEVNQSAALGPLNGPVVVKEEEDRPTSLMSTWLWFLLIIICAVIGLIIGFVAGKRRKREPEVPPEPVDREAEEGPVSLAEMPETSEEELPEEPPADEGDMEDKAADAEEPPEAIEDAEPPTEEAQEAPPEEPRHDLEVKQDEIEAPAGETSTDADAEEADIKKVDEEIDDVLRKLEE